jgi:hypothetical protein
VQGSLPVVVTAALVAPRDRPCRADLAHAQGHVAGFEPQRKRARSVYALQERN